MTGTTTPARTPVRPLVAATLAAAGLEAAMGVLQLTRPDPGTGAHDATVHVLLTGFALALVAATPLWPALGRRVGSRWPGPVLVAGNLLLAAGATASNLNGSDPEFFGPVATVANALVLMGLVAFAVLAWRRAALPRPLAVALPVYLLGVVPLAQLGGSLLRAGVLLGVLWFLVVRR